MSEDAGDTINGKHFRLEPSMCRLEEKIIYRVSTHHGNSTHWTLDDLSSLQFNPTPRVSVTGKRNFLPN